MKPFLAVLLLTCATACGAGPAAKTPHQSSRGDDDGEIEVPRTVITPHSDASIPELMRDADALAAAKRWPQAAAAYDRIYRLEPEKNVGDQALWGAANAFDQAHQLDLAAARFELFARRQPDTALGTAALVRAARIHVFRGRFAAAGVHAELLLKRLDALNDLAKISVYSAKALAVLEQDEDQRASYFIEKARDIIDRNQLDRAAPLERDVAQLYYALGELRRVRAARIKFEPMVPAFPQLLEARCQLLLDAQSAYSDTMRAHDSHWSAMAGYRIAQLYQDLHQDLLAVKPPPSADTERKRHLFEGAVRTRYAVLLTKAKGMATHTLAMADRVGENSAWVERTRSALEAIDQAIANEETALAKLAPYTRADFEAYLAEMEAKAAPASAPTPRPAPAPAPRPAPPAR